MEMVINSYDAVAADPLAEGGDPGYRNRIFEPVAEDVAGRMGLDAG